LHGEIIEQVFVRNQDHRFGLGPRDQETVKRVPTRDVQGAGGSGMAKRYGKFHKTLRSDDGFKISREQGRLG
jgi:hypothetical protein